MKLSARLDTDYFLGMATMNKEGKILLEIDKVHSAEDIIILDRAA